MDNLGAILGPLLGILLVALAGIRGAILISVIPGLLAAGAILYAIRHTPQPAKREHQPIRLQIRPVLLACSSRWRWRPRGHAADLARHLLTPGHGKTPAVQLALALYTAYNIAARDQRPSRATTVAEHPAILAGAIGFLFAFLLLALTSPGFLILAIAFILAGIGIGCAETAENAAVAALAPTELRGSAFGLLAAIQSLGNFGASAIAGLLWTAVSPTAAFLFTAAAMLVAVIALVPTIRHS